MERPPGRYPARKAGPDLFNLDNGTAEMKVPRGSEAGKVARLAVS